MFRRIIYVFTAVVACQPVLADDRIPPNLLERIKAATVFVKSRSGNDQGIGSGFVIKAGPGQHFVVTNYFAVNPGPTNGFLPGKNNRPLRQPTIEVVLNSGMSIEETCKADVVADDPGTYLALLRLRDPKAMPDALDHTLETKFTETLPIFFLGFPFGQELSNNGKNPLVSVGRGSVTSIRENDRGEKIIQIDGDINRGNAGGPIVDAQGRLIGVAIVKITGTKIGLITPTSQIAKLLEPRVTRLTLTSGPWNDRQPTVQCTAELCDPLGRIQSVDLRHGSAENRKSLTLGKNNTWPEMDDASSQNLTIKDGRATGKIQISVGQSSPARISLQIVLGCDNQAISRSNVRTVMIRPGQTTTMEGESPFNLGTRSLVERSSQTAVAKKAATVVGRLLVPADLESKRSYTTYHQRMCWSKDGQSLFVLGRDIIRKLSVPDLRETATTPSLLRKNLAVGMSSQGLVTFGGGHPDDSAMPKGLQVQRINVTDTDTLETIHSVVLKGHHVRLATAPASSMAYMGNQPIRNAGLTVVDLAKGAVVKDHGLTDLGFPEPSLDQMVLSSDGRCLVSRSSSKLYRFRVSGTEVTLDETSPPLLEMSSQENLAISADGNWVRATCKDRNSGPAIDGRRGFCTHLFAMESFAKPAQSLEGLGATRIAGFDHKNGYVYFPSPNRIDVLDTIGTYVAGYELANTPVGHHDIYQMLVHPDGQFVAFLVPDKSSGDVLVVMLELFNNN